MARIISASIDLSKIDKSKIVTTDKNGKPYTKGQKFLNISININDEENQFGQDTSISVAQSKEERESNTAKTYLGNGKTVWKDEQNQATPKAQATQSNTANDNDLNF